jgi:ketosteroid isomerase-like protein
MDLQRRDLAAVGAWALGMTALAGTAQAADDEAGLAQQVEALRKAVLAQDKGALETLVSDQLSYGHSSAVVQNKAEFVNGVMTRKATVKSLEFPELKVSLAGDAAITRHLYVSESEQDGKTDNVKIGVLAVWHQQAGSWKLLARQGYKLPA